VKQASTHEDEQEMYATHNGELVAHEQAELDEALCADVSFKLQQSTEAVMEAVTHIEWEARGERARQKLV
jgi:hypothetical protein